MAYGVNNVSQRDFTTQWTRKQKQEMCRDFQRQSRLEAANIVMPARKQDCGDILDLCHSLEVAVWNHLFMLFHQLIEGKPMSLSTFKSLRTCPHYSVG